MGTMQVVTGAASLPQHIDEIKRGETAKGTAGLVLASGNIVTGGIETTGSIAPGALSEGAMDGLGKLAYPLMAAQGIYDLSTAAPGDRGSVTGRIVASNATTALLSGTATGAAGVLLPAAAGIGAGMALEQDIKISDLEHKHAATLASITPDTNGFQHLQNIADSLERTMQMARVADTIPKGKNGKIDLNDDKTLHAIRESFSTDLQKKLNALPPQEQRHSLQAEGFVLEQALEERTALKESGKDFAMRNGHVDLRNTDNLHRLNADISRDRDAATKIMDATAQMDARPNFTRMDITIPGPVISAAASAATGMPAVPTNDAHIGKGETVLRTHMEAEVRAKNMDVAKAESEYLLTGRGGNISKGTEKPAENHVQTFTYTHRDTGKYDRADGRNFNKADDKNPPLSEDVKAQFLTDPEHNRVIKRVYKVNGHEETRYWQIIDPQVRQQSQPPTSTAPSPTDNAPSRYLVTQVDNHSGPVTTPTPPPTAALPGKNNQAAAVRS